MRTLLLAAVIACLPAAARAQQRPLVTEDPETIGAGRVLLETGIDYGRVYGPNTAILAGTQLAGAVIGIRGGMPATYAAFSYDLFAGTPIYKPAGFPTARVTAGVQATIQF